MIYFHVVKDFQIFSNVDIFIWRIITLLKAWLDYIQCNELLNILYQIRVFIFYKLFYIAIKHFSVSFTIIFLVFEFETLLTW